MQWTWLALIRVWLLRSPYQTWHWREIKDLPPFHLPLLKCRTTALCDKHANRSTRCYSLSYRTRFQQHGAAGARTARGHTDRKKVLSGFCSHRLHLCPTGWLHIWANAVQQARTGGAASFPSRTAHPGMPGLRQGTALPLLSSCVTPVTCQPVSRAGESSAQGQKQRSQTLFCITCSHTVHREEKVMKPMLPVLRGRLHSPSGWA